MCVRSVCPTVRRHTVTQWTVAVAHTDSSNGNSNSNSTAAVARSPHGARTEHRDRADKDTRHMELRTDDKQRRACSIDSLALDATPRAPRDTSLESVRSSRPGPAARRLGEAASAATRARRGERTDLTDDIRWGVDASPGRQPTPTPEARDAGAHQFIGGQIHVHYMWWR